MDGMEGGRSIRKGGAMVEEGHRNKTERREMENRKTRKELGEGHGRERVDGNGNPEVVGNGEDKRKEEMFGSVGDDDSGQGCEGLQKRGKLGEKVSDGGVGRTGEQAVAEEEVQGGGVESGRSVDGTRVENGEIGSGMRVRTVTAIQENGKGGGNTLGREDIRADSNVVWNVVGPVVLYSGDERGSEDAEEERNAGGHEVGRYVDLWNGGGAERVGRRSEGIVGGFRTAVLPAEVILEAAGQDGVSRHGSGWQGRVDKSTRGEERADREGSEVVVGERRERVDSAGMGKRSRFSGVLALEDEVGEMGSEGSLEDSGSEMGMEGEERGVGDSAGDAQEYERSVGESERLVGERG